jgi:hypothetical protein
MPQLSSIQLFKNLSDETRLGIVLLLREMGNCAYVICVLHWSSHNLKYPAIWQCCGKAEFCWIASRENGLTTAYRRISLMGRADYRASLVKPTRRRSGHRPQAGIS